MARSRVLLAVNCQQAPSYSNRAILRELYGDRFPDLIFVVGAGCQPDPDYPTMVSRWQPPSPGNRCLCLTEEGLSHSTTLHHTHPRLAELWGVCRHFDYLVFAEDDCLLSPALDPSKIAAKAEGFDALLPCLWYCDRENPDGWYWTDHPSGYPTYDRLSNVFDRRRLWRNYSAATGQVGMPGLAAPLFGGFVDILILRTDFLARISDDLQALSELWHELAIPTAVLHQTGRIGWLSGNALWGADRNQPLRSIIDSLTGDYLHPVKLRKHDRAEVAPLYAALRERLAGLDTGAVFSG